MDISADKKIIHDYDHGVVWITEETDAFAQTSFRLNEIKEEEEEVEVEDKVEVKYEYEGNFPVDVKQEEQEDSYDEKYFVCTDADIKEESMDSIEDYNDSEIKVEEEIDIDDCSEGKITVDSEVHVNHASDDNCNQVRPTRSSTRLRKPRIFSNCVTETDPLFLSTSENRKNRKRGQNFDQILNRKKKIHNAIEKKCHIVMSEKIHELQLSLSVELGINPHINDDASEDNSNQVSPTRSSTRLRKPKIFSNCVTERDPLYRSPSILNTSKNMKRDRKLPEDFIDKRTRKLPEDFIGKRIIHNTMEKNRRIIMAKHFHELHLSLSIELGINPPKKSILNSAVEDIRHLTALEKYLSMEVRALKLEKLRLSKRLSQDIKRYEKLISRIKEDSEADLNVLIEKDSESSDLSVRIKKDSKSSDLNIRIRKDSESSDHWEVI